MDSPRTVFPDIITSRLEDLWSAPLPGEEAPQYFDALRQLEEKALELAPAERRTELQALITEMSGLSERVRHLYVRFAYIQGLQDGGKLREVLGSPAR
ncbi:hypothetical protein NNJEOMEG_03148 [Fundidesulfovibrio magnetotacticus]|uniref:Uncharacterized protein n=1 Tax=Fundidesulfovibrio magnetotacticus TaxID=2730080 RepID=A0A6V8LZ45_9BACT|nr:hypothetical protein [Fundidesulfovibrio magnetotacticus]GFK95289.1 hypothetical protein NNJEOMEG_03148 [Fundidesulfovibrio magnetotacticus]